MLHIDLLVEESLGTLAFLVVPLFLSWIPWVLVLLAALGDQAIGWAYRRWPAPSSARGLLPPLLFALLGQVLTYFSTRIFWAMGWAGAVAEGIPVAWYICLLGSSVVSASWLSRAAASAYGWGWSRRVGLGAAMLLVLPLIAAFLRVGMGMMAYAAVEKAALPWDHNVPVTYAGRELLPGLRSGMSPEEFLAAMGKDRHLGVYLPGTSRQYPTGGAVFQKMNFIELVAWPYESEGLVGWVGADFVDRHLMGVSFVPDDGDAAFKVCGAKTIATPPVFPGLPYLCGGGHAPDFSERWDAYRAKLVAERGLALNQLKWLDDAVLPDGTLLCEWGGGEFWYEDPDATAVLTVENWRRRFGPKIVSRISLR